MRRHHAPTVRSAAVALLAAVPISAQPGPGLGNLTYAGNELFQPAAVIRSQNGHGTALMVSGYLMLVDAGDNSPNPIAIEFWDLSNPRAPRLAHRHADGNTARLGESHSFAVSGGYGGMHVAFQSRRGVQIWEVSNPAAPVFESELQLPNIQGVYGSIWWVFWQAPYLYVAGSSAGLYVAKVDDVRNPVYVKTIPPSQLAGIAPSQVFACGNLMILRQSKEFGFVTLNAEDPLNPVFAQTIRGERGYSSIFAAGKFITSGGDGGPVQMLVHDVTHGGAMSLVGSAGSGFSNGAYGSYQDGFFHTGMSNVYAKIDVAGLSVAGTATTGIANRDEDFCQVLGNLAFVGDDHGVGSGLYVHDTDPDRRGPDVHWVHPADGATGVGLSSRIGISMSDNVDFASLDGSTFAVRPLGSSTSISGVHSGQMGLCNFTPDQPLMPATTYEVSVTGVRDVAGNAGGSFRSTFTTRPAATGGAPVTNLAAASGKAYQNGTLAQGAPMYIDRTYSYSAMPPRFDGQPYVLTANDDKFGTGPAYVTFDLSAASQVNVLYDERATQLPEWLSAFTPTGENTSGFDVHARTYPAGTVILGGNANPPMAGAQSMYTVVVVPLNTPPRCDPPTLNATETGVSATLTANVVGGTPPFSYSWDFGDGSPPTAPSSNPVATHTYADAGRYPVVVQVTNALGTTSCSALQIIHDPVTPTPPAASTTMLYHSGRVYCVNADQDTVTAFGAPTMRKLWELPTGDHPRTLALAADDELWVVNQDDASISVYETRFGTRTRDIALPRGSQPYGIAFAPDGSAAFVSLQGVGGVVKVDRDGQILGRKWLDGRARGVAVTADGQRVLVTRFISTAPATTGMLWELDAATMATLRVFPLRFDPGPDTESSGRGVPNYLTSVRISPSGNAALVPSKKDNTARGLFRSGEPLTFESRVRTIVSRLDLAAGVEDTAARIDLNDRDMAQAAIYSPLGDLYFVAAQGSNVVDVFDTASNALVATLPVDLAPQGLAIDSDRERLLVHNFMSRSVTVFDIAAMLAGTTYVAPRLYEVGTTAREALPAEVLVGKQIFYNADDRRMNLDGYLSCASCHLDGGGDGQVWDFTQSGEGLRNTIPLRGRGGLNHGNVHWTANFDEIQDFEHDIRDGFGGRGFLTAAQLAAASTPLGPPKAGMSAELDALAAYVGSLDAFDENPFAQASSPTARVRGTSGKAIFDRMQCARCHVPPTYTDGLRHDVGTIQPSSGLGLGAPLPGLGFETPTLLGLWNSAPYLHNGQAANLSEVLDNAMHGNTDTLTPDERKRLARYLLQLR